MEVKVNVCSINLLEFLENKNACSEQPYSTALLSNEQTCKFRKNLMYWSKTGRRGDF
jgi:hypothetical protein